jgi:hypothetical protein
LRQGLIGEAVQKGGPDGVLKRPLQLAEASRQPPRAFALLQKIQGRGRAVGDVVRRVDRLGPAGTPSAQTVYRAMARDGGEPGNRARAIGAESRGAAPNR